MAEKKIQSQITVSDNAQIIALAISLLKRASSYEAEKLLRTIAAYFDLHVGKRES